MNFLPSMKVSAQGVWSGGCVVDDVATIQGLACLAGNILSAILTAIGFVCLVMIIVSAFNLLLSNGNAQSMSKAKNTLTFAILGLVVALSAFIILNLISSFTGLEALKEVTIPGSATIW